MSGSETIIIFLAIAAMLAITYTVTRPPPPAPNDCSNGRWLQLGKDDEAIKETLAGKSYFEYCTNAYYKDQDPETIRAGLSQDADGVFGCCSCYDPSSHRIVASGKRCEADPTDDDCTAYLGQYGKARPIEGAYSFPGGSFSNVRTSMLCGCQDNHGWGDLDKTQNCSKTAISCKSKQDKRQVCMDGNIPEQPINDQGQYSKCCCPANQHWDGKTCQCDGQVLCIQSDFSQITPQSKSGMADKIIPLQIGDLNSCSCTQEGYRAFVFEPGPTQDITDNVSVQGLPSAPYLRCDMTDPESQQGCVEGAAVNGTKIDCQCKGCKGASEWSASKTGGSFHCCDGGTCPDGGLPACDESIWNETPPPGQTKQDWQSEYCVNYCQPDFTGHISCKNHIAAHNVMAQTKM